LLNGGMFDAMLNLNSDQKAKIRDIFVAKSKQTVAIQRAPGVSSA
jgi:hypothetical protein